MSRNQSAHRLITVRLKQAPKSDIGILHYEDEKPNRKQRRVMASCTRKGERPFLLSGVN